MRGLSTPRQVMEATNVLHNWLLKVRTDMRLEFRELPTVPLFRVGAWSGADFKDASKNSGEDIYNRSIVEGTGADGLPVRFSKHQPEKSLTLAGAPQPANPTASTDTTGWSGDVSRRTDTYDSAPASFSCNAGAGVAGAGRFFQTVAGFKPGRLYMLAVRARGTIGCDLAYVRFGQAGSVTALPDPEDTAWVTLTRLWLANSANALVEVGASSFAADPGDPLVYADSFEIYQYLGPTVVDRREFVRTHVTSVSAAITPEVGEQIADTFLATHKRTPLKGDISVKGRGGVRRYLGDASVPPSELLIHTGELVHLAHQVDPDTGALGRDAVIDSVTWTEDEDTANISLDSQRDNLAALLARYDAVVGGGR